MWFYTHRLHAALDDLPFLEEKNKKNNNLQLKSSNLFPGSETKRQYVIVPTVFMRLFFFLQLFSVFMPGGGGRWFYFPDGVHRGPSDGLSDLLLCLLELPGV